MREAVLHLSAFTTRSIYGVNYRVKEQSPWLISHSAHNMSSKLKSIDPRATLVTASKS